MDFLYARHPLSFFSLSCMYEENNFGEKLGRSGDK